MPIIRTLAPAELVKYRDHLLRLSTEDRRLRFAHRVSDAAIDSFVGSLRPTQNHIFVVENDEGRVIAAVQAALREHAGVELAFSVDVEHRGRGLAGALVARAVLWARNRRLEFVYLSCLAENHPVRRLARRLGMRIELDSGNAEARMTLPPPSHLSLLREMAYDIAALRHARLAYWRQRSPLRRLAAAHQ
ncbi:MAG: GNAT family N-acetyltransferase [Rhodospirillales bacterium]